MRFLFSCIPSEGHFRPLLPLARALDAAGHDVVFATAAAWEPRVAAERFATLPAGPSDEERRRRFAPYREELFALPPEVRRPLLFTRLFALINAPEKLPELIDAARAWGAEAIVYDSCDLAAPIAAAALGLPSVNHSFGGMIPLAALELAHEAVAPLWEAAGLERAPYAGAFRGLHIDLSPPSFAWEQPLGENVRMRPIPGDPGAAPAWIDELEPPLVYVTLGTVFNEPALFRLLLDGLDGEEFSALVTTGRDVDPASFGALPPRVRVERFVPQVHVLERCAAVLSHGGSGTTLGALAFGLPLVLVPRGADQFDNAARCVAAGAAIVLGPEELDAVAVRDALRRVLAEPSIRTAAAGIAAEIAAMPTPAEAAAAVEAYVGRR